MFPRQPKTQRPAFSDQRRAFAAGFLSLALTLAVSGCGPKFTYPADKVPESIEEISKKENKLDVTARVVGRTAGALITIDNLVDEKGQIPKEVHEKMGQIMQAVTRVALSTDREIDFCVVVIRDRAHMNELTVTRSLDDTKRANSDAIGIEESINRTLFGQGKYQPSPEGEKNFVLKEVKMENFLAEQVAQRIRFNFSKSDKEDEPAAQSFVLVDGLYDPSPDAKRFRFAMLSLKAAEPRETMISVLKTVRDVLDGYHFSDYNEIEILDYLNRQKLTISQKVLAAYAAKKISEQEILDRYLTESQSVQEAFKLFGFNIADPSASDTDNPPVPVATTP